MANDPSGWMPGVERVPFRSFASSGIAEDSMFPQAIVQHVMSGYMAGARAMALNNLEGTPPSWHFSIGRDGHVMQHVSIWDTAWHCGITRDVIPVALVTSLRDRFGRDPNTWTVGIEHEGFSIPALYNGKRVDDYVYDTEHPWPDAMIEASIRVQKWVWNQCGWLIEITDRIEREERFLMHSMIDTVNRVQDPGTVWRDTVWDRIVNGVFELAVAHRVGAPPPTIPAAGDAATPTPVAVETAWDSRLAELAKSVVDLEGVTKRLRGDLTDYRSAIGR